MSMDITWTDLFIAAEPQLKIININWAQHRGSTSLEAWEMHICSYIEMGIKFITNHNPLGGIQILRTYPTHTPMYHPHFGTLPLFEEKKI